MFTCFVWPLTLVYLRLSFFAPVDARKLLLVSFDGLRWDFTRRVETPNFDKMAKQGSKAAYVTPAMLTLTSVCHTTIATGLYPESHGVVHNSLFDQYTGERLGYYDTCNQSRWFDAGGEPIWVTASMQGMKTGVYRWPGGTVSIKGVRPDYSVLNTNFNGTTDWQGRVDTVLKWFTSGGIDLGVLYFNQPDYVLHSFGTESNELLKMLKECDSALGYLLDKIKELKLDVNIIVTSDHGHLNYIKPGELDQAIELYKYVNKSDVEFLLADYGPTALIRPVQGKMEHVYSSLKNAHPNLTVYKKEVFPDFWHYAKNSRIPPIIAMADPGYEIFTLFHGYNNVNFTSDHGYDNRLMSMKASFWAMGPDIKEGATLGELLSVDIYPLMAKLLGVTPAPNNGSLSRVDSILINNQTSGGLRIISTPSSILEPVLLILMFRFS